jgi:hypothetical protein
MICFLSLFIIWGRSEAGPILKGQSTPSNRPFKQVQQKIEFSEPWSIAFRFDVESDNLFFTRLADEELKQIRGGFGGFHFAIDFYGIFNKQGEIAGSLFSNENASTSADDSVQSLPSGASEVFTPSSGVEASRVELDGASISAYVGDFRGASGIFQISQSPGSYNVIRNHLNISITIYNLINESQLPSILSNISAQ